MNIYDFLLAAALLTTPPDAPVAPVPEEAFPQLRSALQALAVEWEILDAREARYILARPDDLRADVLLLRQRFHDLQDAPPVCDSERFPDRATVNDMLAFNRAYRQHIDNRQLMDLANWWALKVVLEETDRLYQVWDTVRDARCEYYYVTVRRQALKRLRDTLGPEAYYSGQLPPYVPVWHFQDGN
ncbi:MAG: hypothetical protein ACK4RK_08965 [Gemmataceae bacterium]